MEKFHIAVGSKNPIKIQAALAGFEQMFPEQEFAVNGFDVASGVSDHPMSCEETLQGATNRATALRSLAPEADFFAGIEGGIEIIGETLFANAWIVIADSAGRTTSGRSGSFPLRLVPVAAESIGSPVFGRPAIRKSRTTNLAATIVP